MMRHFLRVFALLGVLGLSGQSYGATVFCSHIEICRLLKEIASASKSPFKVDALKGEIHDLHEFTPNVAQTKQLLDAEFWIGLPEPLAPWEKKIADKRGKNSFLLPVTKGIPGESEESLSHFWLSPKAYVEAAQNIINKLIEWKVLESPNTSELRSVKEMNLVEAKFQMADIKKKGLTVILLHDALSPFFSTLNLPTISLQTSHHHAGPDPDSLKRLELILKAPDSKTLWVQEKQLHGSSAVYKKYKKRITKTLEIVTDGDPQNEPWTVFDKILGKLNEF